MKIFNLEKRFDRFHLLIDELELLDGKIYGFIGSNGCGKTTAAKIMAGLLKADGGVIDYEGLTPREITMVSRKPYMLHDTVMKNLAYPLSLRKIKPDKEVIEHYLEMAGLQDMRESYAPSLSAGEQQKLSLIRALIFSPKLIFIDEAFSNLDIESLAAFENFILDKQKKEPVTWVMINHQLSHIRRMCDYVFFMYKGRIEACGTREEIFYKTENEKLKEYFQYETLDSAVGG